MEIQSPTHRAALKRSEALSKILDSAIRIPGTRIKIGLDPLVGLIPGIGDAISTLISATIVLDAARIGVPNQALFRMVGNIVIDSALGAIPFVGDLFDFAWKSNERNLRILRSVSIVGPENERPVTRVARMVGIVAVLLLLLVIVIAIGLTVTISKLVNTVV